MPRRGRNKSYPYAFGRERTQTLSASAGNRRFGGFFGASSPLLLKLMRDAMVLIAENFVRDAWRILDWPDRTSMALRRLNRFRSK